MSTKDLPQRDNNTNKEYTTLTLLHSIQEGRHKVKHKTKKEIQLGDYLDHKQDLVITKDHKQNISYNTRS